MANNAFIQFSKTKTSASKFAIKNSHLVKRENTHPMFQAFVEEEDEKINFLNRIKNFKP